MSNFLGFPLNLGTRQFDKIFASEHQVVRQTQSIRDLKHKNRITFHKTTQKLIL